MMRSAFSLFAWFAIAAPAIGAEPAAYLKDIKPTLQARCYPCHGALQQKGGLRVDTAKSMLEAGVVVPGKSGDSPLISHVLEKDGLARMPPKSEGEGLTGHQVDLLRRWIDGGASSPPDEKSDPDPREHWSFRPIVRPRVPSGFAASIEIKNPVDSFLASQWVKHGLTPQAQAEKRLLLRRVSLDLTGLPPTQREIHEFLEDPSADAYDKVVNRLLESPHYGERWGRHFLDIWRYSDWWGLGAELRNSQKHIWHWRDWTVESLNSDLGYDEMVRQMLAADELYPQDPAKLRATGYLARSYFLFNRTSWLDEVIEHTSKAFLGLTVNCAKCHDHKYDAVRQDDYYRLRAFFEPYQVRTDMVAGQVDLEKDGIPRVFDCNLDVPTYKHERGDDRRPLTSRLMEPGVPALLAFAELRIEPVKLPLEVARPELKHHVVAAYRRDAELTLKNALNDLDKAKKAPPQGSAEQGQARLAAAEKAVAAARAESAAVAARGAADRAEGNKDAARSAAWTEKLAALAAAELNLARAEAELTSANKNTQPAAKKKVETARAALTAAKESAKKPAESHTPLRGASKARESNLETDASRLKPFPAMSTGRRTALARWIADKRNPLTARVLVNHVWARHFGRPLVATIFDFGRKGTAPTHPELLDWLASELMDSGWSIKHLHRLIVTSAAYRMSSSSRIESPSLRAAEIDPENKYYWRQNPTRMEAQAVRDALLHLAGQLDPALGGPSVPLPQQEESRRRSLYFFQSHNEHNPFLSQFDDANVLECYRRTESIVPQQALALSNSKLALRASDAIARRLLAQASDASDEKFIPLAFETVLGYSPTLAETDACKDALRDWNAELKAGKHPDPLRKARTNLVGALVNHNDFITIR